MPEAVNIEFGQRPIGVSTDVPERVLHHRARRVSTLAALKRRTFAAGERGLHLRDAVTPDAACCGCGRARGFRAGAVRLLRRLCYRLVGRG
jgi:hypothetical protein